MGAVKKERAMERTQKGEKEKSNFAILKTNRQIFDIKNWEKKKLVTILNLAAVTTILNLVAAVFGWLLFFSPFFFWNK
jgi:hypothetical protein